MLCLTRRKFERKYKFKGLDDNVLQYNGFVQKYENPKLLCNFLFFICQFCRSEILHDSKHGIFGKKLTRKSLVRVLELAYDTTWFFFPFFFLIKAREAMFFSANRYLAFITVALWNLSLLYITAQNTKSPFGSHIFQLF